MKQSTHASPLNSNVAPLTTFVNAFACLYLKANAKEICGEIFSFFVRKMLTAAFYSRFKAAFFGKNASYHHEVFFLSIPIALAESNFFHMI